MKAITFNNDIKVFYITAASYPEGIMDAHEKLHALIPFSTDRKFFGISRPENGEIVYRAGVEEDSPGEANKFKCNTLILKKGNYSCITIRDYKQNLNAIAETFETLLKQPNLDPVGYCVEWYFNDKDVRCMIRLEE